METNEYSLFQVQQAVMNILEDFSYEKELMEDTQKAILNILYDVSSDKKFTENSHIALLNILEDFNEEKFSLQRTQNAMINILDDFNLEKSNLENMQKAVINILEDYSNEMDRIALMNTELTEARSNLEGNIEARTSELKASMEELESFSYSISHDLRAPLRAITGYTQILKEDYSGKFDAEGEEALEFIIKNTKKMSVLIDSILSISRLGRQVVNQNPIDMNKLTEKVYSEITTNSERESITFILTPLRDALGDATMVEQLLSNLISNAIKYSSKKENPVIEIGMADPITYYIKDNGVGFDNRFRKQMFGLFQRLHKVSEFSGTGVGLAIAQKVVHHHQGKIWATSVLGRGSTFFFTLEPTRSSISEDIVYEH